MTRYDDSPFRPEVPMLAPFRAFWRGLREFRRAPSEWTRFGYPLNLDHASGRRTMHALTLHWWDD